MGDAPEIPEAKDPFEKRVALTIAILAICLSFVGNLGDNAKTDAILKTNEAANQWGYYQAKSIKGQMAAMHADLLQRITGLGTPEARKTHDELDANAERYEREKAEIKAPAEGFQRDAAHQSAINDRCDLASLLLQIAVIICSVSILAQSHRFWWGGIALGATGVVVSVTAFLL